MTRTALYALLGGLLLAAPMPGIAQDRHDEMKEQETDDIAEDTDRLRQQVEALFDIDRAENAEEYDEAVKRFDQADKDAARRRAIHEHTRETGEPAPRKTKPSPDEAPAVEATPPVVEQAPAAEADGDDAADADVGEPEGDGE